MKDDVRSKREDRARTDPAASAPRPEAHSSPGGSPGAVLGLQRMAGNRAVSRHIAGTAVVQRKLTKEADAALTLAVAKAGERKQKFFENTNLEEESAEDTDDITYSQAKTLVNDKLPTAQQDDVIDVGGGGFFSKKNSEAAAVRKLVQAYLLKGVAKPIGGLASHRDRPKEADRVPKWEKQKLEQYAKKSLVVRDQYKPLVKMKPTAPEVLAFLETQGFADNAEMPATTTKKTHKGPRIEVRASLSGKAGSKFPMRIHLFIVYTAIDGKQWFVRGGPGAPVTADPDFGDLEDGYVTTSVGRFTASSVDYDPSASSVTVLDGPKAAEKFDTLLAAAEQVNSARVPYTAQIGGLTSMAGENCNAAAWTILDKAGVPTRKPTGIHPGWGKPLGRQLWDGMAKKNKKEIAKGTYTLPAPRGAGNLAEFGEDAGPDVERCAVAPGGAKLFKDRLGADLIAMLAEGAEVDVLRESEGTALVREADGPRRTGYVLVSKLLLDDEEDSASDVSDGESEEEADPRAAKITAPGDAPMYDKGGRAIGNYFDAGQDIEVIDDDYAPGQTGNFLVRGKIFGHLEQAYIPGAKIQLVAPAVVAQDTTTTTDANVIDGATHMIAPGGAESSGEYGSEEGTIPAGTMVKLAEGFEGPHEGWEKLQIVFVVGGKKKFGQIFFDRLVAV